MKTVRQENGYTIEFNGSSTYFVTDDTDTCIFATDTERKANNFLNSTLKYQGVA